MSGLLGYFGDERRARRGTELVNSLVETGLTGAVVRRLGRGRTGEMGLTRFLHCRDVTPPEMVATARVRVADLCEGRDILVIQDTTSLRDDGMGHSLNLHAAIVVEAETGTLLGLAHAVFLNHASKVETHCNKRGLDEKESRRWVDAAREAEPLLRRGAAGVTMVADRESDIYDVFALCPAGLHVLVRAKHNRALGDGKRLFAELSRSPVMGRRTVHLAAAPGRPARDAVVTVRVMPVTLRRPKRNRAAEAAKLPPEVAVTLIEARETRPPDGSEPIHWRLVTSHPVACMPDAARVIRRYRQRWTIEQVFRTMKTKGFNIEASRVRDGGPYENLTTATLIAAIQVMQLVQGRDGASNRPMTDVIDADNLPMLEAVNTTVEGGSTRQKNPFRPGSLAFLAWVCARLGGWTIYYGEPGPITMLRGLLALQAKLNGAAILAEELARAVLLPPDQRDGDSLVTKIRKSQVTTR
jgi:hypothetical protein